MEIASQGLTGSDPEKAIDDVARRGASYADILAMIERTPVAENEREKLKGHAARFTL